MCIIIDENIVINIPPANGLYTLAQSNDIEKQAEMGHCGLYCCDRPFNVNILCEYSDYAGLGPKNRGSLIISTREGGKDITVS